MSARDGALATASAFLREVQSVSPGQELSPALVSMLERGKRTWLPWHVDVYDAVLRLVDRPISRAAAMAGVAVDTTPVPRVEAPTQRLADQLDAYLQGEPVDEVDLRCIVVWLTTRSEPLGRRSW